MLKLIVLKSGIHLALYVDYDNPLQFYIAICEFAQDILKANGTLIFEINEYLGEEMSALMQEFNTKAINSRRIFLIRIEW